MNVHPLILQLDAGGNPTRWITYEDAAYYYAKDLVAWTPSEEGFTIYGGINRASQSRSFMDMNTIIAIKGEVGGKFLHRPPNLTNKALFRRDHNLCAYCGNIFTYDDLTRDHVNPKAQKGKDVWSNVVTACGHCNKMKDDRTPEQAKMPLLYLPYVPSRSEYLILMNRNILADQMEFLMARIGANSRLHSTVH